MDTYKNLMSECPERKQVYGGISYAFFGFVLFPLILSFCNFGYALTTEQSLWVDIVFHAVNFIAALITYFVYLRESFWNMRFYFKRFAKITAIGVGAILLVALILFDNARRFGSMLFVQGVLPLSELELTHLAGAIVVSKPVLGTAFMVLLTPFTISCLFYATAFATLGTERPWFGYLATAGMLAVPRIVNGLTFWDWREEMILYLIQLPIHMIACRLYQKTDTIWAPIVALMAVNLLGCGLMLLLFV